VIRSRLQAFLARIYVDDVLRARFLSDPGAEARAAGLAPNEVEALGRIDRVGLALASASFARKRDSKRHGRPWRLLGH
jgi:hypothetical protein